MAWYFQLIFYKLNISMVEKLIIIITKQIKDIWYCSGIVNGQYLSFDGNNILLAQRKMKNHLLRQNVHGELKFQKPIV